MCSVKYERFCMPLASLQTSRGGAYVSRQIVKDKYRSAPMLDTAMFGSAYITNSCLIHSSTSSRWAQERWISDSESVVDLAIFIPIDYRCQIRV